MNKKGIRKYFRIMPVIALVLLFLTLIFPTAIYENRLFGSLIEKWSIWMFGYSNYYYEFGSRVIWATDPLVAFANIQLTIIIVNTLVHLVATIVYLKNEPTAIYLGEGLIVIVLIITYTVLQELNFFLEGISFWLYS